MAGAIGGQYITAPDLLAGADLSSSQYKVVKPASTAGEVIAGAAATDKIIGVLQNAPADGEAALVAVSGVVKALAEASVAAGDHITTSTTGRVKTTTTGNNHVLGVALKASAAAGDIIPIVITLGNY